tara:strand:- start:12 stop:1133 length:1122 start_codon:yes stop_codon:yes gene_type:complete
MVKAFEEDLIANIFNYLQSLENSTNRFHFYPAREGLLDNGKNLKLGFSCLALKSFYITGLWDRLPNDEKQGWIAYINSFQKNNKDFPENSFVDSNYLTGFENLDFKRLSKKTIKSFLNLTTLFSFDNDSKIKTDGIRAETKQAISTLYQVDSKNNLKYLDFPFENNEIDNFLSNLNWNKPWSAGAQFSALCVFSKTQLSKNQSLITSKKLASFADSIVNKNNGAYFKGAEPERSELINGCMKVLTGLDWIETSINYPEKLIDLCLESKPSQEGCDLVDIVYVLYRSQKETDYRKEEVVQFFYNLIAVIEKHYFYGLGGFSYYINKSQVNYYGLKITKGKNIPDLHGTTLLLWALSMIYETIESESISWKIIKP